MYWRSESTTLSLRTTERREDVLGRERHGAAAGRASGDLDGALVDVDVGDVHRDELADADARREEELKDEVVADGAEVAVAAAGGVVAGDGELFDLLFGSGEEGAHFAVGEDGRNAILDRLLDLQLAGGRLADDALLFEEAEEHLERGDFAADRRVAVRALAELVEIALEVLGGDRDRGDVIHMQIELRKIRLVGTNGPVGQIAHGVAMLEELGDCLLHVHSQSRLGAA